MVNPLRVLLSGPGLIGQKHAALLNENPDTILAGIVAPDHSASYEFARAQGVPHYTTLETALTLSSVDALIVSSPNSAHFEQVEGALRSGLPVLVEKPLTETLASAAKLVKVAETQSTPVLVGHHRTYSPLLEVARQFLMSDSFGTPVAMQGTALFYKPDDYFAAGPWRSQRGGGPILINMIHEVGVMRHLFGEIDSITAQVSNAIRSFEVEDSVVISLSFVNGALGTFLLSDVSASTKSWEMTAGEDPAYPFFPNQDCYHFAGTRGSLDFPSMRIVSYGKNSAPSWWEPFEERRLETKREDPLARQLQHFVAVARGLEIPRVSIRDGFLNMVAVEAICRAAETGQRIKLSTLIE